MVLNYKQCNTLFRSHVFSMKKMKVSKISATLLFWTKKKTRKNLFFVFFKNMFFFRAFRTLRARYNSMNFPVCEAHRGRVNAGKQHFLLPLLKFRHFGLAIAL